MDSVTLKTKRELLITSANAQIAILNTLIEEAEAEEKEAQEKNKTE